MAKNLLKRTCHCFFVFLFLFVASSLTLAHATTFYIDFQNGNDRNAGTSTSTAWKTIPGTRTTGNTDWQSTCWGSGCPGTPTIDSSNRVPKGTVFKIKSGTTYSSSNGGEIRINSTYYATDADWTSPITFQRDTSWGSGSVTFDADGMTMPVNDRYGLIHVVDIGGLIFDGVAGVSNSYDGFIIRDCDVSGISFEITRMGPILGGKIYYTKFYNNHKTDREHFAGQIWFGGNVGGGGTWTDAVIDHCEFDGNGNHCEGLELGAPNIMVTNATVSNCVSYNHLFSINSDDAGMGFKGVNVANLTMTNCEAYNNGKGMDNGNKWCQKDPTFHGHWKWINCTFRGNTGENSTAYAQYSSGLGITGSVSGASPNYAYVINCIIRDNASQGLVWYGSGYLYVVHSVLDNNGTGSPGNWERPNIRLNPDGHQFTGLMRVYLYNNIFYKPAGGKNGRTPYWHKDYSNFSIDSDYNSWVQRASEVFWGFGEFAGYSCGQDHTYGANGPGHTSGEWYSYYSCGPSGYPRLSMPEGAPRSGTGHYHCDANSKGTGATDTTLPPFLDVTNHDYRLTTHYLGTNLSGKSWYISDMGKDRNGNTRSSWDIGAYEFIEVSTLAPPKNLRMPAN